LPSLRSAVIADKARFAELASGDQFVSFPQLGSLGRLGNQLFQIAATVGTARKHGYYYVLPPWKYSQYLSNRISQTSILGPARNYVEQAFCYQDIPITGPTSLHGFFQTQRYFEHCEEEIRNLFTPHPVIMSKLTSKFGDLLERETCSLHIRRGDYVKISRMADLTDTDYFDRAVAQLNDDKTFLIFSDDIDWCKKQFRGRQFVYIEGLKDIADLFMMSLCHAHIISNSSFSWWGAWLDPNPDKKVIAPARWFAGSLADPRIPYSSAPRFIGYHDTKDLIPESWIKL